MDFSDITLTNYKVANRPKLSPEIFRPIFDAIKNFKALGVYHGDLSSSNILLSPSEAPTRAFLIDFGRAGVREHGMSEEDWTSLYEFYSDEMGFGAALNWSGIPWPSL